MRKTKELEESLRISQEELDAVKRRLEYKPTVDMRESLSRMASSSLRSKGSPFAILQRRRCVELKERINNLERENEILSSLNKALSNF